MGKKTVHVSDFSGKVIQSGDEVVSVVVLEHPDLVAGPVRLDALPVEVEAIDDATLDVAVVEIHDRHGHGQPRTVVLTASEFDGLATDVPMAQLLRTAERVRPVKAAKRAGSERLDYGTLEHAGKPHRGKITDEEARLVREHLGEINERLAAEGLRLVDPADPDHAARYGFPEPPVEGSDGGATVPASAASSAPTPGDERPGAGAGDPGSETPEGGAPGR